MTKLAFRHLANGSTLFCAQLVPQFCYPHHSHILPMFRDLSHKVEFLSDRKLTYLNPCQMIQFRKYTISEMENKFSTPLLLSVEYFLGVIF